MSTLIEFIETGIVGQTVKSIAEQGDDLSINLENGNQVLLPLRAAGNGAVFRTPHEQRGWTLGHSQHAVEDLVKSRFVGKEIVNVYGGKHMLVIGLKTSNYVRLPIDHTEHDVRFVDNQNGTTFEWAPSGADHDVLVNWGDMDDDMQITGLVM